MNYFSKLLLFNFILFSSTSFTQIGNLIWEDNFNDTILDTTYWSYETGTGVNGDWGTGQLDRATERVENVSFEENIVGADNGCLVITTREEFYIDRNYTSGRINSADKASWGPGHRIVAKVFPRDVKHPGQGFAFWMMPDEIPAGWSYIMWPQGGEIDIMEYVGAIPYHNLGSVHFAWSWENNQWQSWNHSNQGAYYSYELEEVPDPPSPGYGGYPATASDPNAGSTGFHEYGVDWFSDRIEFFVDSTVYHVHYLNDGSAFALDGQDEMAISEISGKRIASSEYSNHFAEWHPFEHKMYAILSAGVGGSTNTYGGAVVPEANFPCSVFIDWVKVYELESNSIGEEENQFNPIIFPNPTNDLIFFKLDQPEKYAVNIADMSGKIVFTAMLNASLSVDVSKLASGNYTIFVSDGKMTFSRKIVVE